MVFSLILSTLFISLAWVSVSPILAKSEPNDTTKEIQNAEQQFKEAFESIREAETAGAGENQIAGLIDRLNSALNLIEQAKRESEQGDITDIDETTAQATYICNQLKNETNQLRDAALTSSYYSKILLYSIVPVAALIVTVCVHYGLRWWRRSEVERIMKMEIREKK